MELNLTVNLQKLTNTMASSERITSSIRSFLKWTESTLIIIVDFE